MELKITDREIAILERYKNEALLNNYRLCYVRDFEIKEKIEETFFGKLIKKKYLTKYKVAYYNSLEKQVFIADDRKALVWLPIKSPDYLQEHLRHDIYKCRENWLNVKETITGFGHKLISDSELKELEKEKHEMPL